jgi:hypothetical protein
MAAPRFLAGDLAAQEERAFSAIHEAKGSDDVDSSQAGFSATRSSDQFEP